MPRQLADWSAGPNPLTVLLGSLVGCTQYTASMISQELKLGSLEGVAWKAAGPQSWPLAAVRAAKHILAAPLQARLLPVTTLFNPGAPGLPMPTPAGEYDLRGVRGGEPGVDARFQRISLEGTFDTPMSQQDLDRIAEQASQGGGGPLLGDNWIGSAILVPRQLPRARAGSHTTSLLASCRLIGAASWLPRSRPLGWTCS